MQIQIYTQYVENYGHRWKMKGGDEYLIEVSDSLDYSEISWEVALFSQHLLNNDLAYEYVIGWEIVGPDYTDDLYDEFYEGAEEEKYLAYVDYLDSLEDNLIRCMRDG